MTMNEMRAKKLLTELSSILDSFYFSINALQQNFEDGLIKANAAKRLYRKYMKSVRHYDKIQTAIQEKYPASANGVALVCICSFDKFNDFFEN